MTATTTACEMRCCYPIEIEPKTVPESMVKAFRIEAKDDKGNWQVVYSETNNYQRLVKVPLDIETQTIRMLPLPYRLLR